MKDAWDGSGWFDYAYIIGATSVISFLLIDWLFKYFGVIQ